MTMAKEPAGDDPRPVVTDATAGEPVDEPLSDEPDTHTAALQGAAAGGAMGGNAGYAGGLFTGSEDDIGMREIPDNDEDTDAPRVTPGPRDASD
jgi:hypothetical protein